MATSSPRHKIVPPEVRFWRHVNKTDGCWLWTGFTLRGYGRFGLGGRKDGVVYAHRFSYEMAHGPVPDGMSVLHRCDTPGCVRPDHLFLGTYADNTADRIAKGRRIVNQFAGRATCAKGHPYDDANTRLYVRDGTTRRGCRACDREKSLRYLRRKRAHQAALVRSQ